MSTVSRTEVVHAPPQRVWEVVSDLPRMGELSPEATGGTWAKGATGPVVGAVFRGKNAQGKRTWSTKAQVTRCAPGRGFEIHVSSLGLSVADWAYDLVEVTQPDGTAATQVTETWTDRRGGVVRRSGKLLTGVGDREGYAATSIEQTLAALKDKLAAG